MTIKLLYLRQYRFFYFILIFILFSSITKTNAQCAGNDNAITICGADLVNSSSQAVNLFSLLGGGAVSGGTWRDNLLSGGLNLTTGVLNVQAIKKSGVFTYTYTSNVGCGDNSSTITVTVGGYSGVSSPDISACNDDVAFNLFQGFSGQYLGPQTNGIWSDNNGTGALVGGILDAKKAGLGTHSFTYTMPAIGTCPAQSSTVNVTVFRAPVPGTPSMLLLCSSDDLSVYSDFDLNSELAGEDAGGIWSEAGTSEISGILDSKVNVQNIYNLFGAGVYSFTYSVFPDNPICNVKQSTVNIIIEEQLDFTGATLVVNSDICENEITSAAYNAILTKGIKNVPNGNYYVEYSILGPSGTTTNTIIATFSSGVLTFPLPSSNFQQVADYTVRITDIASVSSLGACTNLIDVSDVLHVFPLPKINTATLTIDPICKNSDAVVALSGNTNLSNGNYRVVYNLSGSNTATSRQATFTVSAGLASFSIPASLIPVIGNTTIAITNITNLTTGCTNTSTLSKAFVVKPLTDLSALAIAINNVCQNQPVTVNLSGLGVLTNITLNYNLTGVNTATNQTVILPVTAGNASFVIPALSLVNTGITSLGINDVIDNGGGCGSSVTIGAKSFTIHPFPNNPTVNDQSFCENENATIADLVPNGSQYQWFNSATSTTVLASNTVLVSGNYFVKEVNAVTGCESGKSQVAVVVNEVQAPILDTDGQNFCGFDNPTLQNLSDKTTTISGTITWFDAATGGNQLDSTMLLVDGATYYGYNLSNNSACFSDVLEVTVSLSNCEETAEFFIPDGFSPNNDTVNDTFRIPDIEFIYPNYTLEIYNRYGSLMFKGNKNKPYWDGKNSDSKIAIDGFAPNGVYFYVINFNKGNKSPKQGRLYLNR